MSELVLGDSLEVLIDHRGLTPKKLGGDFTPSGVPVVSAMLVQDRKLQLAEARFVAQDLYRRWMPITTRRHDVLLTSEAPLGRVALVPDDNPLILGQRLFGLRGRSGILDSRFLYYALQTDTVQNRLRGRATGTTVTGIRQSELVKILIPAPKFQRQQAIATVLGALDDRIALNERIAKLALELASGEYQLASEQHGSWHAIPLANAAKWLSGGTPKTSEPTYWDGDVPWISALSLKSPWIDDSDRKITQLGAENGTRLVPKDTVIFVVRGSSLDKEFRVGLTQREVAFGQDCKALRAGHGIDPATLFMAIWSRASEFLKLVDHTGHGAGRLATDLIAKVEIRVPTDPHCSKISALLRSLMDVGAKRRAENRTLAQLRDKLLPGLMTGEIRVRDAEKLVEDVT